MTVIRHDLFDSLICPVCAAHMSKSEDGRSLLCLGARRHCYDFSSSGYVNFAITGSGGGDSKEAVCARRDFLSLGKYEPCSKAVCEILGEYVNEGGTVIDAGCGEGYYSRAVARAGYTVLGFDISKEAVNMAAKASKRSDRGIFFGVGNVFELPIEDGSADAVVNIFAPCVESEYARVLKRGGVLLVAYAGATHLLGLKRAIYEKTYENEPRADMPKGMELLGERRIRFDMRLDTNRDIRNLFEMTPYYWRTSPKDKEKLEDISVLESEIDVVIAVYRKI